MTAAKTFRTGPIAIPTAAPGEAQNLLSPPGAIGGVNAGICAQCIELRAIHVTNDSLATAKFSLFLGASGAAAAGTALIAEQSVRPGETLTFWRMLRVNYLEYITGFANAVNALVVTFEGQIGVGELWTTQLEA
ncbi:hypothetical protein GobsT_23260 [Gemmata obscuriglobus]|uniref:Uncharacterized protein n=1 Tax=Gemmata obscuriglobus TaxID=114 RepID=A0A2Z3H0V0_9BACT|nr:hypothetical protein [Gemmata obscuriglobus]AWM39358.1 hypothetical protein C1280_21805 [Gemmata obscuriglobus]QEG27570.1 hypothetical protein GobsT_23260 [Gemmata obscuriglobus]VTS04661.1 unnamed protein product [Gemmata obscuriglobus UQM 2246]